MMKFHLRSIPGDGIFDENFQSVEKGLHFERARAIVLQQSI